MSDKHVYLSEEDRLSLGILQAKSKECFKKGDAVGGRAHSATMLQILNAGVIEALASGDIHEDEALVYSDLYGTDTGMSSEQFEASALSVEVKLIKNSPLYNNLLELLGRHFTMSQQEV
jgi:hypothetical protein